jgi:ribosome biogenesis GTPase A
MGFLPTHCSNTQSSPAGEKRTIQIQSQFYGDCRKCVILQCQTGNDKAGIPAFQRAIFKVGAHVQERRELKERPLRVGIIGYPNVGKTANTPGITKSLQWILVKDSSRQKEFELLHC